MARTPSIMAPLGSTAPDFSLLDTRSRKTLALNNVKGETATVIMFICNHCPFVKHVIHELTALANDYQGNTGIRFIAISSNDVETYPEDSPLKMKEIAEQMDFPFPYLYDETQAIARAYDAACTPDFFIYDKDLKLVYRGQLDDSRPGNQMPVNGKDIREALNALLSGKPISTNQKPSLGCNIKWKNR